MKVRQQIIQIHPHTDINMADLTVSEGLSLGGRLPSELPYIQQLSRYDAERARRNTLKANDKAFADDLKRHEKDIFVGKNIHPIYQKAVKDVGLRLQDDLLKLHTEDPTDRFGKMRLMDNAMNEVSKYDALSKQAWEFDGKDARQLTPEAVRGRDILHQSTDWNDYKDRLGKEGIVSPYFNVGEEGGFVAPLPPEYVNIPDHFRKVNSDYAKHNMTLLGQGAIGNQEVISQVSRIPDTPEEVFDAIAKIKATGGVPNPDLIRTKDEILDSEWGDRRIRENFIYDLEHKSGRYKPLNMSDEQIKGEFFKANKPLLGGSYTETTRAIPQKTKDFDITTGSGSNLRFNTESTADGGAVIRHIATNEEAPKTRITAPYALKGYAVEDDVKKYADVGFKKEIEGFYRGFKPLTDPVTGKKRLYFIVSNIPETAGSESTGTVTKDGDVTTREGETSKLKTSTKTWLVPASEEQNKSFFAYTGDKKGNNPSKQAFLEAEKKVRDYNFSLKEKGSNKQPKVESDPYGDLK